MSDTPPPKRPLRPTMLGVFDRPVESRITAIEIVAVALSAVWLLGTAVFFLMLAPPPPEEGDSLRLLMTILAVFLPIAMIWVAALAARASKVMRDESQRLQAAIDAMRHTYLSHVQAQNSQLESGPAMARKLEEIATAQKKAASALATFSSTRQSAPLRKPPEAKATALEDQGDLPLGTPAEALSPPLERPDFIMAMNFPENEKDAVGFVALRKALRDRQAGQLVRAAQDILTLLSQDGIYMDDLRPDVARAEVWRRFAGGERGRGISALGGIRDRSSLALAAGRMKTDPVFRDTAHHFLRQFDKMFTEFEETASDADIAALCDTRSARAFMLLGRVAGMFD